jgi:site-specific recombinase XerD
LKNKNEIQPYKKNEVSIKETAWNSLSTESQKAYQSDFDIFFNFIKKPADKVTSNDVLLYIEHLRSQDYKNATINRKIASLSKLFKIMVLSGEIKKNPVDTLKQFKNISFKTNKEVKIALTMEDIKRAIKNPKEEDKEIIIIIRMLAKTGLRISEMINIKNKDIKKHNDNNHIIRIVGKGKKERFVYLESEFLDKIKKVFPVNKKEYLFYNEFGKPFCRKKLWRLISRFFRVKIDKKVKSHDLRHFFITHKIYIDKKDIKSVSLYVGHSSTSITLDMYVDTALSINDSKIKI